MARPTPRFPELASGILVLGATAYAFFCIPAIRTRGYPALDPFWVAVTWMWFLPVCVSALFDSIKFSNRWNQLIVYALVTGFVNAGTIGGVVPRSINPVLILVSTIFYAPVHFVVLLVLETVMQWLYSFGRTLVENKSQPKRFSFSLFYLFAIFSWTCITIGIPVGYDSLVKTSQYTYTVEYAHEAWETRAFMYTNRFDDYLKVDDVLVSFDFDAETGLEYKRYFGDSQYAVLHNQIIEGLIEKHGLPEYSIKEMIPATSEVIEMLGSKTMNRIDQFPYDVNKSICLKQYGAISIVTDHGTHGVGDGTLPVDVKTMGQIIYIRNGPDWVGAFLPNGRMVVSATR